MTLYKACDHYRQPAHSPNTCTACRKARRPPVRRQGMADHQASVQASFQRLPDDLLDVMVGFKEYANCLSWGQECVNPKATVAGDILAHAFSPEALLAAGALLLHACCHTSHSPLSPQTSSVINSEEHRATVVFAL